jgi:guanosine-3',5'-bis(diphosphate) 3'-pyrophosphohydrolase
MSPSDPPDFIARSELLGRAYRFAFAAHEGERSRGKTRIEHPTAVARLLVRQGADDQLVAAALLHDVLEDTTVTREELEREFGPDIAQLVAELS